MGNENLPTNQWFIRLKNWLESFEYNALGINVECGMTNKKPILEDLRQITGAPPVYLAHIMVHCNFRSFDFSAVFDCCFWICRPKQIHIYSNWGFDTDFIDLRHDKLIQWEENPRCCRYSSRKCWRHDLDKVKIHRTITENVDHGPGLTISPQSQERDKKLIVVQLNWKMSGRKRKIHSDRATQEISPTVQRPRLSSGAVTKVLRFLSDPFSIFGTRANMEQQ